MRCLYCGKELALLKRWTGGGEFCSDAHRQQYQEEYNQLALNRLLQAKPRGSETQAEAKASEAKTARQAGDARSPAPAASTKPARGVRASGSRPQERWRPCRNVSSNLCRSQARSRSRTRDGDGAGAAHWRRSPRWKGTRLRPKRDFSLKCRCRQRRAPRRYRFPKRTSTEPPSAAAGAGLRTWATESWGTELVAAGQVAFAPMFRAGELRGARERRQIGTARVRTRGSAGGICFARRGGNRNSRKIRGSHGHFIFSSTSASVAAFVESRRAGVQVRERTGNAGADGFRTTGVEDTESGEVPVPVSPEPAASEPASGAAGCAARTGNGADSGTRRECPGASGDSRGGDTRFALRAVLLSGRLRDPPRTLRSSRRQNRPPKRSRLPSGDQAAAGHPTWPPRRSRETGAGVSLSGFQRRRRAGAALQRSTAASGDGADSFSGSGGSGSVGGSGSGGERGAQTGRANGAGEVRFERATARSTSRQWQRTQTGNGTQSRRGRGGERAGAGKSAAASGEGTSQGKFPGAAGRIVYSAGSGFAEFVARRRRQLLEQTSVSGKSGRGAGGGAGHQWRGVRAFARGQRQGG